MTSSSPPGMLSAHVLLVDDSATIRTIVSEVLVSFGCTVEAVADGGAAVDAVSAAGADFDVVLMDIRMPVIDGIRATQAIRAYEAARASTRRLPILAFTAEAPETIPDDFDGHVKKPVDTIGLYAALSSALTALR